MSQNSKNRPNWKKIAIVGKKPIDLMEAYEDWFEGFENKHRDFSTRGKIYDWLEANVPNWASKGCGYIDLLTLFIKKEILGE